MFISRHHIVPEDDQPKAKEVRTPVNHIWIYDRSGSMTYLLPELALDMIKHVETLQKGDFLSLGWFSTEGTYSFIIKNARISDDNDYLKKMILANFSPIGLTCFSDILRETLETVIPDAVPLSNEFALMFFTDGYPVVSDYFKEVSKIKAICSQLGSVLSSAMMVGYGDYYNRSMLVDMATRLNGSVIHSSRLSEFSESMQEFVGSTVDFKKLKEVDLSHNVLSEIVLAYTIEDYGVVVREVKNDTVHVPEDCKYIWTLTTEKTNGKKVTPGTLLDGMYGGAVASLNALGADKALQIVGCIGDIHYVDEINNAWTNEEFGRSLNSMTKAVYDDVFRFTDGKDEKYLPRADAFCLMDALDVMMEDEQCFFVPTDPSFTYKRIGVKSTPRPGYSDFVKDDYCESRFETTWNSSRLNMSLLCKITGTVNLGPQAQSFGFSQVYRTFVFRNYTIVKDGVLNVSILPMRMSKGTFAILQKNKMIARHYVYDNKAVYPVMLNKVPLVNKQISSVELNSTDYCAYMAQELELMAKYKVINSLFAVDYPKEERKTTNDLLSDDQVKFLESCGITKNGFNPPVDKEESVDYYYAKEFDVKIKGFSSLPKLEDAIAKAGNGTPSQNLMWKYYQDYIDKLGNVGVVKYTQAWYEKELNFIRQDLRRIRGEMSRKRFVLLAGKKWFNDLKERDGAKVNDCDLEFTFTIRDIKVEY